MQVYAHIYTCVCMSVYVCVRETERNGEAARADLALSFSVKVMLVREMRGQRTEDGGGRSVVRCEIALCPSE